MLGPRTPTLDNLNYQEVINLIHHKKTIEKTNNIAARTRLFRKHPELFDKPILQEIIDLHRYATAISKQ